MGIEPGWIEHEGTEHSPGAPCRTCHPEADARLRRDRAAEYLESIRIRVGELRRIVDGLADGATWPAIGSLHHVDEELEELLAGFRS